MHNPEKECPIKLTSELEITFVERRQNKKFIDINRMGIIFLL